MQPPRPRAIAKNAIAPLTLALIALLGIAPHGQAFALDKQGSAHGGNLAGSTSGFALSGALMAGTAFYNPSYAARPDNTGIALNRYAAHADLDLIGQRLSVPLDVNLFSDRARGGAAKLTPSELDVIAGLTSTWGLGRGAVELGAHFEHDRAVDRDNVSQSYFDVRGRYLYSLAAYFPGLSHALHGGDVGGWATLGWFAQNPNYFARPDNTGRALLRYGLHVEVSLLSERLAIGFDQTYFTDRQADNVLRPSELDLTPELIVRGGDFEVHLAYERDMPIDRGGLVQHFAYVLGVWSFSAFGGDSDSGNGPGGQPTDGSN